MNAYNTTGGQNDYVRIEFSHADGDLDLFLLTSNEEVIGSSISITDNERASLHSLPPDVYYVRVLGCDGATNPSYRLVVQTDAPSTRLLSAPFTTDEAYTLECAVAAAPESSDFDLQMGPNELILTAPNGGGDPFELIFDVTRVGSMVDQTQYQYDELDSLSRVTDALGRDTVYEYDGLRRLVKVDGPDVGDRSNFAYDGNDNLILMQDHRGDIHYAYDELDRLTEITLPDSVSTIGYGYDPAGRITSITYPNGTAVAYTYDAAGRLETVTQGSDITSYTYYGDGLLRTVKLPNGVTGTYDYDDYARLTDLSYTDADGQLVTSFHYGLDDNGNRTSMEVRRRDNDTPDPNDYLTGLYEYHYDALDRLDKASYPDGTVVEYVYDANGNRLSTSTDPDGDGPQQAVIEDYHYGQDNRLERITDADGASSVSGCPRDSHEVHLQRIQPADIDDPRLWHTAANNLDVGV